ncbi:LysR family transcriptional regulator [Pseudoalteromonas piscicida]|uniref:LysR family transcriptional regulator n=1 Tax=Pseudoalteromonas piscicida TaxID=43662 RepID=A0AAQ2ETT4_PSEO7|nr:MULTISPECIES: LysR family transcriptional regulator [Pseudoalteromonas]TMN35706.1 LysR family transcriptional regulator [Pseudoalteromonas piscicida]TMN44479.1 LysR family transcriptional regulator [Pseudoalteromonas piscicida]TMN49149.1 LysR family transcriptional regulator [Pseudoalteromonas piscicida]TMN51286.1 LysR family transcriptional regulator [Pseudoalteromonas piscicida]TMN56367.1 LysR family transcriptional regulator [Pseudoalteromonas piscicida]
MIEFSAMEFYHLRSFVAVAEAQNLTAAAKRLYTTPPAISAHIKALEEELNTVLFHRSSKGMQLTEQGKILLDKAKLTLASANDLMHTAAQAKTLLTGEFRLGLNHPIGTSSELGALIKTLNQHLPSLSFSLELLPSGVIVDKLSDGLLDGGVIYGEVPAHFSAVPLTEVAVTTAYPASWPVPSHKAELAQMTWIRMGKGCPFDKQLDQQLSEVNAVNINAADERSRLALVKAGLGVSFIEANAIVDQGAEVALSSLLDFSLPVHFVVANQALTEPKVNAVYQVVCASIDVAQG